MWIPCHGSRRSLFSCEGCELRPLLESGSCTPSPHTRERALQYTYSTGHISGEERERSYQSGSHSSTCPGLPFVAGKPWRKCLIQWRHREMVKRLAQTANHILGLLAGEATCSFSQRLTFLHDDCSHVGCSSWITRQI